MAKISEEFISRFSSETTAKAVLLAWLFSVDENNHRDKKEIIFSHTFRKSEIKNELNYFVFLTKTHDPITLTWAFDVMAGFKYSDEAESFLKSCIDLAACDGVITPKELVILNYIASLLGYENSIIEMIELNIDEPVKLRVDYDSNQHNSGRYKHENLSSIENAIQIHLVLNKALEAYLRAAEKHTSKHIIRSYQEEVGLEFDKESTWITELPPCNSSTIFNHSRIFMEIQECNFFNNLGFLYLFSCD